MRSAKQLAVASSLAFLVLCDSSAMTSAKPKPEDHDRESSTPAVPSALTRTEAIVRLIAELQPSLAEGAVRKVAVLDLTDLDGNCSALGRFLAEELTTGLSRVGGIEVVERNRLRQVLTDLSEFTAPEPESYKTLQQSLGVEAVLLGTLTPLGNTTRINVRVIKTGTGQVVTAAAQEFAMDPPLVRLLETPCHQAGSAAAVAAVTTSAAARPDSAVSGPPSRVRSLKEMSLLQGNWTAHPETIIRDQAYPSAVYFNAERIVVRLLQRFSRFKMKVGVDDGAGLSGRKHFWIKDHRGNVLFTGYAQPMQAPVAVDIDVSHADWLDITALDYNGQTPQFVRWINLEFAEKATGR